MKDDRSVKATLILYEGVLNDDELEILESQYVYTGRNFATCKITYWTFANEWANNKHEKYFQKVESAIEWYKKNLKDRVIEQGKYWLKEDEITDPTESEAIDEWENMTLYCEI